MDVAYGKQNCRMDEYYKSIGHNEMVDEETFSIKT